MDTVIRVAVIYVVIVIGLRLTGKREFGQLSPLELVSLLLVPEIVSQAMANDDFSITNGIIGVATLFTLVFLSSLLMHRFKPVEKIFNGDPSVLIAHGRMIEDMMNKERVTPEEIYTEMHKAGLDRIEQVKWAILEGDGKISIVPEAGEVHVTSDAARSADATT